MSTPANSRNSGAKSTLVDDVFADAASLNLSRIADDKGHPQRLFVHESFVIPAMITEKEALVTGVHHDRVLAQPRLIQVVEDPANVVIDAGDDSEIVLDVMLVSPLAQLHLRKLLIDRALDVLGIHVQPDAHGRCFGSGCSLGVVIVERFRLRNNLVQIHVCVLLVRLPRTMWCLVMIQKAEWLVGIPLFEPIQREVSDQIRHVSRHRASFATIVIFEDEVWVVIQALPWQNCPIIKITRAMIRSHAKVPLPKDGGLVSTLAQQARERGHAVVQVRGKCGHLVDVIVGAQSGSRPGLACKSRSCRSNYPAACLHSQSGPSWASY